MLELIYFALKAIWHLHMSSSTLFGCILQMKYLKKYLPNLTLSPELNIFKTYYITCQLMPKGTF